MPKTLKGQKVSEDDYADVRKQLEKIFYEIVFKPVVALLAPHNKQVKDAAREMKNAVEDPVIAALKTGKVQYSSGVFSGEFNAATSKALKAIGAKYNSRTKVFTLAADLVPKPVLDMAKKYQDTAKELHDELKKRLDEMESVLDGSVSKHPVDATVVVGKVQRGFERSVGDALGNSELSDESRTQLKRDYTTSLAPYIKKFSAETIAELRAEVEANALAGYRFDHLVDRIQNRFDVSHSKAEFLARQETSIYVSKHRQTRFAESGVTQYVWRTAGGPRVREDHRKLNGRTFSYKNPPIVDEATGRRANAGEDFNCRCVADPVLPDVVILKNSTPTLQLQESIA